MYLKGEGVSPDSSTAVKWYRQAAEQGVSAAQYAMGAMYARGEGVPVQYVKTYAWWKLAASEGEENAIKGMDMLRSRMTRHTSDRGAEARRRAHRYCRSRPGGNSNPKRSRT